MNYVVEFPHGGMCEVVNVVNVLYMSGEGW